MSKSKTILFKKKWVILFLCLCTIISLYNYNNIRDLTRSSRHRLKNAFREWRALSKLDVKIPDAFLKRTPNTIETPYIAHASGQVDAFTYTNSQEALEAAYAQGFRLFEVDISWTRDGHLVLLHDWDAALADLFHTMPKHCSLAEFYQLKMKGGRYHQMSFSDLMHWATDHPDACIVTDIKEDNVKALEKIHIDYPTLTEKIIPQIYNFDELVTVANNNYSQFILTLYKKSYSDKALLDFAKHFKPLAITMSTAKGLSSLPQQLKAIGIKSYVVLSATNTQLWKLLEDNGVYGVYTPVLP